MALKIKNLGYNRFLFDFGDTVLMSSKTQTGKESVELGDLSVFEEVKKLVLNFSSVVVSCKIKPRGAAGPSTPDTISRVDGGLSMKSPTSTLIQLQIIYDHYVIKLGIFTSSGKTYIDGETGTVPWNT